MALSELVNTFARQWTANRRTRGATRSAAAYRTIEWSVHGRDVERRWAKMNGWRWDTGRWSVTLQWLSTYRRQHAHAHAAAAVAYGCCCCCSSSHSCCCQSLAAITQRSAFSSILNNVITSAEEGGYVFGSVCLSVCPSDHSQTCERILTEFFWRGRAWLKDQVIQFWWRSGSRFGSGSPMSEIRILRIGGGLCSLSAFLVLLM